VPEQWEIAEAAKVRGFGPPEALDKLTPPPGVRAGRVAGDEVLWVGERGKAGKLVQTLGAELSGYGNRATVVDHSDGYALFSLTGPGRDELFARLSSIRIPAVDAFVQGNFAGVPARTFRLADRLEVIVTSDVAWFVSGRLEHAAHDLEHRGGAS
jgi:sarcosine oxidase gamma subunit